MICKWIKKIKDKRELKKSNWGRDFNWYIEYKNEIIGELIDYEWEEIFWDSYLIKSIKEEHNQILTNPKFWDNFKYKNQHYNQYAENAFAEGRIYEYGIKLNERLSMRGLYLTEIK